MFTRSICRCGWVSSSHISISNCLLSLLSLSSRPLGKDGGNERSMDCKLARPPLPGDGFPDGNPWSGLQQENGSRSPPRLSAGRLLLFCSNVWDPLLSHLSFNSSDILE